MVHYLNGADSDIESRLSGLAPYRVIVLIEKLVDDATQSKISELLAATGCLYMMAWGANCSSWDDSVDHANLLKHDYSDIPEDSFIMTTWHSEESLQDVFGFAKSIAVHPTVLISSTVLLHFGEADRKEELVRCYEDS